MKYTDFLLEPIFARSGVTDIHLYSVESRPGSSVKLSDTERMFAFNIDLYSINYVMLHNMLLGNRREYYNILI